MVVEFPLTVIWPQLENEVQRHEHRAHPPDDEYGRGDEGGADLCIVFGRKAQTGVVFERHGCDAEYGDEAA